MGLVASVAIHGGWSLVCHLNVFSNNCLFQEPSQIIEMLTGAAPYTFDEHIFQVTKQFNLFTKLEKRQGKWWSVAKHLSWNSFGNK